MNRKPTSFEKMIMDGVNSEVGPGGTTPTPEEPPAPADDKDD